MNSPFQDLIFLIERMLHTVTIPKILGFVVLFLAILKIHEFISSGNWKYICVQNGNGLGGTVKARLAESVSLAIGGRRRRRPRRRKSPMMHAQLE